jgi:fatty-acyl-CoA synthase
MTRTATIPVLVAEHVQAWPDRPLLRFRNLGDGTDSGYTSGELWQAGLAFALALDNVAPGTLVMIVMPLGKRLLAAHLAIQMRGGIGSIFTHPSDKIRAVVYRRNLEHAVALLRPGAIVVSRDFADVVRDAMRGSSGTIVVAEDVSEFSDTEVRSWHSLTADQTAIVQHSSGSTGLQKGVALSHAMVIGQCESYARFIQLDPKTDHICSWLPLYHDMGLFTAWLMPALHGVPVSMIDPFQWVRRPLSFLQLIGETRGTLCWQPNFAYSLLASRAGHGSGAFDLSSVRGFTNCSEPVTEMAMRAFLDAFRLYGVTEEKLWTCYAMAENAFAVTAAGGPIESTGTINVDHAAFAAGKVRKTNDGPSGRTFVSCGVPIEGVAVRIVDDARQPNLDREIGEIALRSPFMLREYFRNEAATASSLDGAGWYYTGDLGFMVDGRLYVTGRKKDLIIVGGRNFYPQDIERIADECPSAIPGRSVALGIDDPGLGTQRVVVLVESQLTDPSAKIGLASAIREAVFEQLDCPIAAVQVMAPGSLLKTSSGKIARQPNLDRYLRELAPVLQAVPKEEAAPRTATPRRAGTIEVAGWSLAIALAIYLYALIFLLGENESWNIYAGF